MIKGNGWRIRFKITLNLFLIAGFLLFNSGIAWARAGGGEGGGGASGTIPILIILAVIYKIRRARMISKAKADLDQAQKKDPTWNIDDFKKIASATFYAYQKAWTEQDLGSVREHLHIDYFSRANALIERQKKDGIKNILKSIKLTDQTIMSTRDVEGKDGDLFVMELEAQMIDYTVKSESGAFVSSPLEIEEDEDRDSYIRRAMREPNEFSEYWVFIRSNNKWKLWDIKQMDAIISDLKELPEAQLRDALAREQTSNSVDDSAFYKK